ncbi:MAG: NAD(P)-dependent oxidoreductase [Oscillospiraceae bacterium]|nr:NAD(P)-dependent oxidoreductase [Oscillospiraceae bacterium]
MRILLTGGSGFIGGAFLRAWKTKYDLYAPTHQELDLLDADAAEDYLRENCFDLILHTANTNNVVHQDRADRQLDFNLRMFCNLERCRDLYGKMYYFGSGAEYDMRCYQPRMTEDYFGSHIPQDPYGFSKYIMSRMAETSENIYDFRLFGVYGPGEEWRRRFISNMIYQAAEQSEMKMDRNMMFDYLYITDLIAAAEMLIGVTPSRHSYNLCSGQAVSLRALADIVKEETGSRAEIVMNSTEWKPEYTGDNSRFVREFGRFEMTPVRDAIRQMIAYYRENGFH